MEGRVTDVQLVGSSVELLLRILGNDFGHGGVNGVGRSRWSVDEGDRRRWDDEGKRDEDCETLALIKRAVALEWKEAKIELTGCLAALAG